MTFTLAFSRCLTPRAILRSLYHNCQGDYTAQKSKCFRLQQTQPPLAVIFLIVLELVQRVGFKDLKHVHEILHQMVFRQTLSGQPEHLALVGGLQVPGVTVSLVEKDHIPGASLGRELLDPAQRRVLDGQPGFLPGLPDGGRGEGFTRLYMSAGAVS